MRSHVGPSTSKARRRSATGANRSTPLALLRYARMRPLASPRGARVRPAGQGGRAAYRPPAARSGDRRWSLAWAATLFLCRPLLPSGVASAKGRWFADLPASTLPHLLGRLTASSGQRRLKAARHNRSAVRARAATRAMAPKSPARLQVRRCAGIHSCTHSTMGAGQRGHPSPLAPRGG
jgi:hypothetical protein